MTVQLRIRSPFYLSAHFTLLDGRTYNLCIRFPVSSSVAAYLVRKASVSIEYASPPERWSATNYLKGLWDAQATLNAVSQIRLQSIPKRSQNTHHEPLSLQHKTLIETMRFSVPVFFLYKSPVFTLNCLWVQTSTRNAVPSFLSICSMRG